MNREGTTRDPRGVISSSRQWDIKDILNSSSPCMSLPFSLYLLTHLPCICDKGCSIS